MLENPTPSQEAGNNQSLSASQYQQLITLLNQHQISSNLTEPPQSGRHSCSYKTSVCLINCHSTADWIIDYGATDHITPEIILYDVLLIPTFQLNLVSVSKLTHNSACCV